MLERWYPTAHVPSVFAIDYEKLAALGYNLVLAGNRREPLETVKGEILGDPTAPGTAAGFRRKEALITFF